MKTQTGSKWLLVFSLLLTIQRHCVSGQGGQGSQGVVCADAGQKDDVPDFRISLELTFPMCSNLPPADSLNAVRNVLLDCLTAWHGKDKFIVGIPNPVNCSKDYKFSLGVAPGMSTNFVRCLMGSVVTDMRSCASWLPSPGWPVRPSDFVQRAPDTLPSGCYVDRNGAILCASSSYLFFISVVITSCVGGVAAVIMIGHTCRQRSQLVALRRQLEQARMMEAVREVELMEERLKDMVVYVGVVVINPDEVHLAGIVLDEDGKPITETIDDLPTTQNANAATDASGSSTTDSSEPSSSARGGWRRRRDLPGPRGAEVSWDAAWRMRERVAAAHVEVNAAAWHSSSHPATTQPATADAPGSTSDSAAWGPPDNQPSPAGTYAAAATQLVQADAGSQYAPPGPVTSTTVQADVPAGGEASVQTSQNSQRSGPSASTPGPPQDPRGSSAPAPLAPSSRGLSVLSSSVVAVSRPGSNPGVLPATAEGAPRLAPTALLAGELPAQRGWSLGTRTRRLLNGWSGWRVHSARTDQHVTRSTLSTPAPGVSPHSWSRVRSAATVRPSTAPPPSGPEAV